MATVTAVTKENLQQFENRLNRLVARKKTATRIGKTCAVVGNVVFMLCFFVVTCAVLALIMDEKELEVLNKIPLLVPLWNKFTGLLPADLSLFIQILAGCVAAAIIPFAVNLPLSIILRFIPVKEAAAGMETDLEKAKRLEAEASKANHGAWVDDLGAKIATGVLYAIGVIVVPCYVTYMVEGEKWAALLKFEVIIASLLLAGIALVGFAAFSYLSSWICKMLYFHRKDQALNKAFSDYVKVCEKLEKEEKARKEKAEKQRKETERLAEEKKRREQGAVLYAQATAGDEMDEELLQQAADLGDPQASMIIGKRLMQDGKSDLYTDAEKNALMEKAAGYFKNTTDVPEGVLYWTVCKVKYESNTKATWQFMLKRLRNLKETSKLSEEDLELCDDTIRTLVRTIDSFVENTPREPEKPREPRLKRKYCRFCGNGSICTYYSTGGYISLCKYPNNPGDCAAALMGKGLAFEFE